MRKPTFWFPTWSDTNQAVQFQKMARGLHYLCSENKDADQLRGYREADLRLCFRICKMLGFLMTRLNYHPVLRAKITVNFLFSRLLISVHKRMFFSLSCYFENQQDNLVVF